MKQNKIFYAIVKNFFAFLLRIYNRCSVKWPENFTLKDFPNKNFIVACNHVSNLDPLVVGCFFPRMLKYLAKEELFHNPVFGACIRALGAVPVARDTNASAAGALRGFIKLYQEGSDVLIFPEGGRSLDGKLQPLEGGVAVIAARCQAPILPAVIKGAYEAMPTGAAFVKPKKIKLTFGEPLTFSEDVYKSKEGRAVIMAELEKAMKKLEAA